MAIFHNENAMKPAVSDAAYSVDYSCRFDGASWLSRTFSSAGTRTKWTLALWVKRSKTGTQQAIMTTPNGGTDSTWFDLFFDSSDQLWIAGYDTYWRKTAAVYRDPSAWMHVCVVYDTAQSGDDELKLYVNSAQITDWTSTDNTGLGGDLGVSAAALHYFGRTGGGLYLSNYIADVHFIDGTAIAPLDNFVEKDANGQLVPIAYTEDHGTNGFHIPFDNTAGSDVFTDSSGSNAATAFTDSSRACQHITNSGAVHSATEKKIGRTSMYFDGNDRLIVSGNSALSIPASTDFCIECWFYPTDVDTSGQVGLIMNRSSPSENGFWISQTDQNLDCRLAGTNAGGWEGVTTTTSNPLTLNTWHHIAYCRSGTGTDNITLYVDGVAEDTATSNAADDAAAGRDWVIGRFFTDADNSAYYIQGYLDEIRFSTGTPRYTGAGQTPTAAFTDDENTVLLIHSNYGGGIGGDDSGKTNDFAAGGNLAAHDQMVDTPSAGNNFCTWNPLGGATKGLYADLSDGNLRLDWSSASQAQAVGTIEMTSGKWYFEATINDVNWLNLGVSSDYAYDGSNWGDIYTIYTSTNNGYEVHHEGSSTGSWSGSAVTPAVGDVIGIAFDADNGKIWYSVNGSGFDSSSPDDTINPYSAGEKSWHVNMSAWQSSTNVNFGADHTFANQKTALVSPCTPDDGPGEFYYDVPAGFKALCTANLDAPGLNNAVAAEKAFEVITYEGNATETAIPHSGTSPTTMPFNADLIWGKNRSNSVGYHHGIADSVRGISSSSTPILKSSSSVGDIDTSAQIEGVSGNQITLGDNSDSNNYFNLNDDDYVIWAWKAGTAGTRVNGDINSNSTNYAESYNADAGFSIIKYDSGGSGSSMDDSGNMYDDLAHSLSSPVELGLFKMRNPDDGVGGGTQSWAVFHKDLDDGKNLSLDGTGDQSTDNNFVDPANVSSGSVLGDNHISLYYGESGTGSSGGYGVNRTNDQFATGQFIAYLFRSIDGYSKVGSWQSSGTSPLTEPFIYCGFRPAYVWVKRYEGSSSYGNWVVQDNKRNTHNVVDKWLFPNLADDEYTYTTMDFLSNGFKIRTTTGSNVNYSNWKYAFYAVAEIPFQYASAR